MVRLACGSEDEPWWISQKSSNEEDLAFNCAALQLRGTGCIYLDCNNLSACTRGKDCAKHANLPRSKGWVTQAAKQLALPPNQNGYLMCACAVAFFAGLSCFAILAVFIYLYWSKGH